MNLYVCIDLRREYFPFRPIDKKDKNLTVSIKFSNFSDYYKNVEAKYSKIFFNIKFKGRY